MLVVVAALLFSVPSQQAPGWVWWEAEQAKDTNFVSADRNPFAPMTPAEEDQLSGGKWIGTDAKRTQPLYAEYEVQVPKNATYQFYARKFWKHGPYRWRADSGPWTSIGNDVALMDDAPLRKFLGANWTYAGETKLEKGSHTIRVELTTNEGAACFDAFILTSEPFVARGKMKPGQKYNRTNPGYFAFEPDPDPYKPSAIDLRSLNEKAAGDGGFIGVKGEEFVHKASGKPVKFWAVNTGADTLRFDKATVRNIARGWAKSGVNLVRVHGAPWGSDFRKADKEHIERLFVFVDAMKKEGIYTCISIYFPLWLNLDAKSGFPGYNGKNPFALLFFNKEFQSIYRGWWRDLLTAKSPIDGKTLAEDPSVAMLEIVNEDSNLFWTFTPYENVPGPQMEILEKGFGAWLVTKHGSLAKAFTAWGGGKVRGDDVATGRAGFMPLWEVFNKKDQRAKDTAAYLTDLQRTFFTDTYKFLKTDLGYKASIYGSNWITADARILGPLDKWSNTVGDFMDRHGYYDVAHTGERASYMISPGDKYEDRSALLFSGNKPSDPPNFSLPIFDIRYDGKPSTITEINWTPPNALRADFPIVAAAYGALQGTDAIFFFATGAPWWEEMLGKFGIRTPVTFGQFPATALMYRQGLVKPGPTVVEANLTLQQLFNLEGAPVSTPASLDQFRQKDIPAGQSASVAKMESMDPLAFLVGKVDFNFVQNPTPSKTFDLSKYIDHGTKIVKSATGELTWDYGKGLVTVNAPAAQGVTGNLSRAGEVRLAGLTIQSPLNYGSVMVVSLDGKPLATSTKMLVQVMSQEKNYGWETSGGPQKEIKSIGAPPMTVQDLVGRLTFTRADEKSLKVTPLDFNGYPKGAAKIGGVIAFDASTLYYLVEK